IEEIHGMQFESLLRIPADVDADLLRSDLLQDSAVARLEPCELFRFYPPLPQAADLIPMTVLVFRRAASEIEHALVRQRCDVCGDVLDADQLHLQSVLMQR